MVKKKQEKVKNFVVVYNGNIGKKADSIKSAIVIAKDYISLGKCKKAEVYEMVKQVQ